MYDFMPESDAAQKWCPFATARGKHLQVDNLNFKTSRFEVDGEFTVRCIGHHCMAWITERQVPENIQPGEARSKGHCGMMMVWRP